MDFDHCQMDAIRYIEDGSHGPSRRRTLSCLWRCPHRDDAEHGTWARVLTGCPCEACAARRARGKGAPTPLLGTSRRSLDRAAVRMADLKRIARYMETAPEFIASRDAAEHARAEGRTISAEEVRKRLYGRKEH